MDGRSNSHFLGLTRVRIETEEIETVSIFSPEISVSRTETKPD